MFNEFDTSTPEGIAAFHEAFDKWQAKSLAWQHKQHEFHDYVNDIVRKYANNPKYLGKEVVGILLTNGGHAAFICEPDNFPWGGINNVRDRFVDPSNPQSTGSYAHYSMMISPHTVEYLDSCRPR